MDKVRLNVLCFGLLDGVSKINFGCSYVDRWSWRLVPLLLCLSPCIWELGIVNDIRIRKYGRMILRSLLGVDHGA